MSFEEYLKDISIFKNYINNLFNLDDTNNKLYYNETDFWNLLLLLSKSYVNDNFHKMFDETNEDYLEIVFSGSVTMENYYDNTFSANNNEILKLLLDNQYVSISPIITDYKKLFKIIRNHLSHCNYKFKNNIISFYNKENKVTISFSVATLCLILLAALSNRGQSKKINSYESGIVFINDIPLEITVTNKIDDNEITPLEMLRTLLPIQIDNLLKIIKNQINDFSKEECQVLAIEVLKQLLPDFTREYGYNLKFEFIDKDIMKHVLNYFDKYEQQINVQEYGNLYYMIKDDIKRSTISYKKHIEILYMLLNNQNVFCSIREYLPILNNEIIISYLNLVFCDYAICRNSAVSNEYFDYLNPNDEKKIPKKLRNSLAHCHYKFQDITDSSSYIIIEFWDELKNIINFECRIKKENVEELINDYIIIMKKNSD